MYRTLYRNNPANHHQSEATQNRIKTAWRMLSMQSARYFSARYTGTITLIRGFKRSLSFNDFPNFSVIFKNKRQFLDGQLLNRYSNRSAETSLFQARIAQNKDTRYSFGGITPALLARIEYFAKIIFRFLFAESAICISPLSSKKAMH